MVIAGGTGGTGGIEGDPAVVEGAAAAITTAAATMTTAGRDVGAHGDAVVARWSGSASQAAHERVRHLSDRTDVGAEVVGELPKILTDYAAELRQAQADHAAGVAAAQAAATALSTARTAMAAARAVDDGPDRASAMRLSGEGQRYAEEGVAAASHTIEAAIARERTANTIAADAVRALTTRLAGMDPRPPGAIPPVSVRAIEAAEGYEDQGPPPAWIERAAQTAVDAASGAADTAYIVPQGFGYLVLRSMGYSHEQAIARLESDHEKLRAASGAQTDSAVYTFFDLHDDIDEANAGTDGGGPREVAGAVGEVGWHIGPGALAAWGHANPDPGPQALAWSLDTTHDRLEDEWGTQTDTRLYQRGVLLGDITTVVAGPAALRGGQKLAGAAAERSTARVAEQHAADVAAHEVREQAQREAAHGEALTEDTARTSAILTATAPHRAQMSALEMAAGKQAVTEAQATGYPFPGPNNPPTPGQLAPSLGRSTAANGVDVDSVATYLTSGETHTWAKHMVKKQDFPGITTPDELAAVAADVMRFGEVKQIRPGVWMYYKDDVVVVHNTIPSPYTVDVGSVFPSAYGARYFLTQASLR